MSATFTLTPRRLWLCLSPLAWTLLLLLWTHSARSQQSNMAGWGGDQFGQLGDGYTPYLPHPTLGISGVKAISTGTFFSTNTSHTIALKLDGTVWAWGCDYNGELGNGTSDFDPHPMPVQVLGPGGSGFLTGVTSIAEGEAHSVALKQDGTVWAWGWNSYGQLGDGTTTTRNTPVHVLGPGGSGFLTGVKAIAGGGGHTVALKQDGSVWTWGDNGNGQLGDGTTTSHSTPVQVLGPGGSGFLTGVKAIAGGGEHTMALKRDGTVWTWGGNWSGQLGDGTKAGQSIPVQVLGPGGSGFLTDVIAIAAGCSHTVALKQDGSIWTWGDNWSGELGDGTTTNHSTPVQVLGPGGSGYLTGVKAIAASFDCTVALKQDGAVWAWGENSSGQAGDGTNSDPPYGKTTPVQVLGQDGAGFLTGVTALAAGDLYTVALKQDGSVWTWGDNFYGQHGDGWTNAPPVAQLASGETMVTAIAAGYVHTVALKQDGSVWTWGGNYNGELGNGTTALQSAPVQVAGQGGSGFLTGVKAIAAGSNFTVALKQDGAVWAWGGNSSGQLGDGTTIDPSQPPYGQTTPVQVLGPGGSGFLTGVIAIAAGGDYTVALKQGGSVWTWGSNVSTPVQVVGPGGSGFLTGVIAIAAGFNSTVALKQDGTVWTWGSSVSTPVQVLGPGGSGFLTGVIAIAAGYFHTVALKQDGTVWTWGYNSEGELGDGTTTGHSIPVQVVGPGGSGFLTGVTAIAAGGYHTLAVKQDGSVWAWGENYDGELGDGTLTTVYPYGKSTPVQVLGLSGSGFLTGVTAIAAGGYHTLALLSAPVTPPPTTVTGKALLQDCLNSRQNLSFDFQPTDGSSSFHRSLVLNADGAFRLDNIPSGSYDLSIQGSKWLRKRVPVYTGRGSVSGLEVLLWAGDVNNDNTVNIFDLSDLADAFFTTPSDTFWNPQADLNCDNSVDVLDLSLLADNFFMNGDP